MEPPLDKQGCNETVGDEAEYIAARGFPLSGFVAYWLDVGRKDWPTHGRELLHLLFWLCFTLN